MPARLRGISLVVTLLLAACMPPLERFPVSREAQPFDAANARLAGTAPPVAATVTFERLVNARSEPQNWLTYYGAYDAQRYSPLDEIDRGNVAQLRPAWIFQSGLIGLVADPSDYAFEAAPLVVDGVLYTTGPDGHVWALDARTGGMLWHYRHAIPLDVPLCCGNVNRGAAIAQGKVFVVTPNGYLVALDAATGKPVWTQVFADVRAGESASLAPLVVKDMVLTGSSGGEYGVRGHIDAFDIATGERRWRRYNVPKPGEPGSESWSGDSWQRGGGTAWITGSYDPELDLVYWGTGNPGPVFDGSVREGANLFTNSIIAFRPDDGKLVWYFQMTPHGMWDYDGVNENILFEQGGRRLLAHFDKNGHLYVLDRTNGALVLATPFARADWGEVDPRTGHVTVRRVPTPGGTEICPGPAGAKEWPHAAYSPRTGLLYVPVVEQCGTFKTADTDFGESLPYWGGDVEIVKERQWGHVKAFDPLSGREVWSWRGEHPMLGSLLATAGDLVFAGEPTGAFSAFDAHTGEKLWSFQTGSGIHSSPVAYSIDGKQYVAVHSGWGGWIKGFAPELYGAPRGDALVVFALP
ncbi:PQQ-dependent dehydrogenase, methanol/ethanol family [Virgifigura deserti]|uniref:PQQ-dependent dehydrogenase, methanol/ethanol family n=1 Tax=Virgifigura deserti TaxID=2268457 RepID=UPI003CCC3590